VFTQTIQRFSSEEQESLTGTCRLFGVDRQVYYRARKAEQASKQKATLVLEKVSALRQQMSRLGTRKLYAKLYEPMRALGVGRDKLFAIMRANHMHIIPKRQYHVTTDSHHRFKKHSNLVEHLELTRPEQVFVADITYIGTREHPMYLSLVTDAYSKKIMGFDVSNSLHATGAIAALHMALKARQYRSEELIHHSDRGLQYCCDEYQKLLVKHQVKTSMTEKYDPYQNAVAERINGILKQEFIRGISIKDIDLMHMLIAESVELYNQERPHYSCYMNTPEQMHRQRKIKIRTYKKKNSTKKIPSAI
jgi:putative transposase